ncbi:hypothetical protein Halhy_3441 [Haliscomenobacter hydrossis DSM 1100]|uniref:Uncharacterized protein n=1 Tax=Haliscomenobacter hydrossis (strain ATCC 27775 / DSM 1100 / LMG 10767 / O) TaxID=760192 RepID=F4KVI4_HALH1|nr:hypothetical protein Halhy_3441 [Haliscomenobacter hydrossis DSM 1100]
MIFYGLLIKGYHFFVFFLSFIHRMFNLPGLG